MNSVFYLAWRYLAYYRWRAAILVAAMSVILFLPLALELVLDQGTARLRARAEATPLVIGAPGSPVELMLNTLYFEGKAGPSLAYGAVDEILKTGLGLPIPMHVQYRVGKEPVVGTSPDDFTFRNLTISSGRRIAFIGEAVLGALFGG